LGTRDVTVSQIRHNRQSDTRPQDTTPLDNVLQPPTTGLLQRLHHTASRTSRIHPYVATTGYIESPIGYNASNSLNEPTTDQHQVPDLTALETHPTTSHSPTGISHLHRYPLQQTQPERPDQLTYIWTSNLHPPRTPGHPNSEFKLTIHGRYTSPI